MTKLNKKLEKHGVRNESCPEDRNEKSTVAFLEIKPWNLTGVRNENDRVIETVRSYLLFFKTC